MCFKDIYVDRYPDGRELEYQRTTICENGTSGHPCAVFYTNHHRHRDITYDELSTQYILNHPTLPTPRNSMSPGRPVEVASSESSRGKHKRRASGMWTRGAANLFGFDRPSSSERKHKQRKEKIVYVDEVPHLGPTMPSSGHLYPPSPRSPYFPPAVSSPPARNDPSPSTQPQTVPTIPSAGRGRPLVVDERNRKPTRPSRSQSTDARGESSSRRTASPARTPNPQIVVIPETEERPRLSSRERRRERERNDETAEERRRRREILLKDEEIRNRPAIPLNSSPRTSRRQSGLVRFEDLEHTHTYDSRPERRERESIYTSREVDLDVGADAVHNRRRRVHSAIGQTIRLQGAVAQGEGGGGVAEYEVRGDRERQEEAVARGAALVRRWEEEELRARREEEIATLERLRVRQMRGPERRNTVALDDWGRRRRERERERERVVYFEEPRFRW